MKARLVHSAWLAAALLLLALISSLLMGPEDSVMLGVTGALMLGTLAAATIGDLKRKAPVTLPDVIALLWLFWIWWFIVGLFSPVSYVSQTAVYKLLALPVSATVSWLLLGRNAHIKVLLNGFLLLTGLVLCAYAYYQFSVLEERPRATFVSLNNFAAFLVLISLISLPPLFRGQRIIAGIVLASLAVFFLTIALISSRGAIAVLLLGMALVCVAAFIWRLSRIRIFGVLVILALGFYGADRLTDGQTLARTSSLQAPLEVSSVNKRMLIWKSSLNMASDYFWLGAGPGSFWLVYPQYKSPQDESAGFYAHNDLLQFCIEVGLPGVVLFLCIAMTMIWRTASLTKTKSVADHVRFESASLLVAISAIVGHSMLTFNLYIMPILISIGICVGAFSSLTTVVNRFQFRIPVVPLLIALIGLCITAGLFYNKAYWGGRAYANAEAALQEKDPISAMASYREAIEHWPDVDGYYYRLAWLIASQGNATADDRKLALRYLVKAESLNPYRPHTHVIRAKITEQDKADTPARNADIISSYEEALRLDPGYLMARFSLARHYLAAGDIEKGTQLLESGLKWAYPPSVLQRNYYRLTAEMRRINGDQEGYRTLMKLVEDVQNTLVKHQLPR